MTKLREGEEIYSEQLGIDPSLDHLQRIRGEQHSFNSAWLASGEPQPRIQRIGFAVLSTAMLALSSMTFVESVPSVRYGGIFMPAVSALLVAASIVGLKKALWPSRALESKRRLRRT